MFLFFLVAILLIGGCTAADSSSFARNPARVMSIADADWLERESRAEQERPDLVIEAMDLHDGQTVADIGCGTGYFTRRLVRAVAPTGRVYAVDVQPVMLELMNDSLDREEIGNVTKVVGSEDDPKLPEQSFDWVLLVDVYHEFQQPEQMLARIRELLKPGGKVAVVEYRLEDDSADYIRFEHRMSVDQILVEWLPAGFELVERIDSLPTQHMFVFRVAG